MKEYDFLKIISRNGDKKNPIDCALENDSMLTLKSKISANIYGPPCVNVRFGFMISDKITESSPYLLRNSFAHSIPS